MKALLLVLLAGAAQALEIKAPSPNSGAITPTTVSASTVTITGTGSKCFSVDDPTLVVDCSLNRVGVGDATPTQTLDVTGTLGISDVQALAITGGNFVVGNPAGGGTQEVRLAAGGDYRLTVQTGGNVGIGTSSPNSKLHVNGTVPEFTLSDSSAGLDLKNWGITSTGGTLRIRRLTDAFSGFTPALNIDSSDKVGIGTASPATTLDVNGDAQFGSGATKSTFTATGFWEPISKTKAQIDTLVPTKAGQVITCSNCATSGDLCISTGTLAAQWRRVGTAAGCGTNE